MQGFVSTTSQMNNQTVNICFIRKSHSFVEYNGGAFKVQKKKLYGIIGQNSKLPKNYFPKQMSMSAQCLRSTDVPTAMNNPDVNSPK